MMKDKIVVSLTYYTSNLDKLLKGVVSTLVKLEEQFYSGLIRISKDVNEISSLMITLDELYIDINLDEFEGLL
tara:strand:- start:32084 stop:32302 length:219 start_codon:yes stop_codon:yes gene_type:complete